MKPQRLSDGERILAVFIDFENLALGFGGRRDRFSIDKVLERLVEKGKIVCKKAYADWSRFGYYTTSLHEAAVELIEIPKRVITGKNSADIRMCVDAMDLAYSKDHIDTFVIVSGDSDFSPLVSKLKELGRDVIGLGLADSTSNLLRDNCDEFIYYEDLDRAPLIPLGEDASIPEPKRKLFALLLDSLLALRRENKELIFSSMVKDTMKRKKPSFNEEYFGYRTFSEMLEDAQTFGILDLEKHKSGGGTYVVTRFGSEPRLPDGRPAVTVLPPVNGGRDSGRDGSRGQRALPPADSGQGQGGRQLTPRRSAELPPRTREPLDARPPTATPAPIAAPVAADVPPPASRRAAASTARPPARPATPVSPPVPPTQVILPARENSREPVEDDRPQLGKALIDDVFDDEDDLPSYMPRKGADKPVAKPALPPARRPASRSQSESAAPRRSSASVAKPAREPSPARRESESRPDEDKPAAPRPPAERKPAAARPAPPPKPTPVDPPKAKAKPAAEASDDFGSGLDD